MAPWSCPNANSRTIKRSQSSAALSIKSFEDRTTGTFPLPTQRSRELVEGVSAQAAVSKGRDPNQHNLSMPSAAGPRMYENHIPSFMSVYGMDSTTVESPSLGHPPKISSTYIDEEEQRSLDDNEKDSEHTQIHLHQHRESTSTQTSDSTDSSPTTTISTVDSSSLSDPSPSSSPESPITLIPLSSFSGSTFGLDSFQSLKMIDTSPSRLAMSDERPMTSPSPRKFKNPKSLALNLNSNVEAFQSSESTSPSFIKPPTLTGRRKPSLLSLNTGAANTLSLSTESLASPSIPTMLQRRGLKHSMSSPQMLATPSFGPSGGMTLGDRKPTLGLSRLKESNLGMKTFTIREDIPEVPAVAQMATRVPGASVGGDSFDRPHSGEDAKSPSYPEGPILMHEPSVHLYLEPKLEEAMEFDVIINVAREVKNPFKLKEEETKTENSTVTRPDSSEVQSESSDIPPDTAASMMSFRTAFEIQPGGSTESSPTTPKPSVEKRTPEYIHVPWDHNTDVKDELWGLCETIDARTREGKKVLVHCQQGASRSATLIIACHMYKNQELGPNEAYSQAQAKSRWVNPNMSLLFSLNDFKKVIDQKKAEKTNTIRKPVVKHRPTLSADALDLPGTPSRARGNSTPSTSARDSALAKADERVEPALSNDPSVSRHGGFDFGFSGLSISNDQPHSETTAWGDLMSPRLSEMTDNPIQNFSQSFSRSFGSTQEVPPTPALFSPRAMEFPRSTFFQSAPPPRAALVAEEDPRSPPTKGEAPIIRSIDDFL